MDKIEIKYEDSFVAFLDILGFTNFVKNGNTDKINTYLERVDEMISNLKINIKSISYCNNINFIVISDSIIISIPKNNINDIDILRALCLSIYSLQGYLALADIWLRGAISSGETYFNDEKKQIIGKGYINAYLLESKISNPQVILDNKIIKELGFTYSKDFINTINDDSINLQILYVWDDVNYIQKDFPFFINYFQFYFNHKHIQDSNFKEFIIEEIVKYIENNIYSNTNLYSKYKWVADYALSLIHKYKDNNFDKFKERLEKL
ncbi:hypothetical protein N5U26_00160 [Aliarcobacter cryaerophilus]|uniref:hypothetical protein n=1 Tax=Aliarcobacter cryaerophilus TaxID=28198 RepID=UPI0021B5E597|nr:hypothetical protein [Aliarcobacter cryaerophilus]MCT7508763.1 hypothetical protein [Aliarcobacter cryaerophilus]